MSLFLQDLNEKVTAYLAKVRRSWHNENILPADLGSWSGMVAWKSG